MNLVLTPLERATAYNAGKWGTRFPDSRLVMGQRGMFTGVWFTGNCYRVASGYYGGYPHTYLERVESLFPDAKSTLHLFSGSVGCDEIGVQFHADLFDIRRDPAMDAHRLADWCRENDKHYDLVIADPPYSKVHAKRYGTKMVDRRRVFRQMAEALEPGACVVWLDTKWPMFRKDEWKLIGTVPILRSTNHDVRASFVFERRARA